MCFLEYVDTVLKVYMFCKKIPNNHLTNQYQVDKSIKPNFMKTSM